MSIESRLRQILNQVNNQINSHAIIVQPRAAFDVIGKLHDYADTFKAVKELAKSYPKEKYGKKDNIILSFVALYGKLREAYDKNDEATMHRLTTTDLYQLWRMEPQNTFKLYKTSTGITFLHAKICVNEYGRWFQGGFRTVHEGNVQKYHVVERKLDQLESHARSWYFCKFQN